MTSLSLGLSPARRVVLGRRIRFLVAATISYNRIEAIVALAAGARASSSVLIGFGLDSVIEVSSAAAVAWQFAGRDPEARERVALKVIAGVAVREGVEAWRGGRCCGPTAALHPAEQETCGCGPGCGDCCTRAQERGSR